MKESARSFDAAIIEYKKCMELCMTNASIEEQKVGAAVATGEVELENAAIKRISFYKEIRGEVLLRITIIKKDQGAVEQSFAFCKTIIQEPFSDKLKANAYCLQVRFEVYPHPL